MPPHPVHRKERDNLFRPESGWRCGPKRFSCPSPRTAGLLSRLALRRKQYHGHLGQILIQAPQVRDRDASASRTRVMVRIGNCHLHECAGPPRYGRPRRLRSKVSDSLAHRPRRQPEPGLICLIESPCCCASLSAVPLSGDDYSSTTADAIQSPSSFANFLRKERPARGIYSPNLSRRFTASIVANTAALTVSCRTRQEPQSTSSARLPPRVTTTVTT